MRVEFLSMLAIGLNNLFQLRERQKCPAMIVEYVSNMNSKAWFVIYTCPKPMKIDRFYWLSFMYAGALTGIS